MTRAHFALLPSLLLCSLVACGSSSDGDSGNSTDAGPLGSDAGAPSAAHGLCAAGPAARSFPDDFGKSCGMGSNKALCVSDNHSSCSSGLCLWHAASPAKRAYCTITCDPDDPASCPARHGCKAQGCSDGPTHVCVRTEAEPEPTCTTHDELLPDRRLSIRSLARTASRLYVAGYARSPSEQLVVLSRPATGGAWELIYEGQIKGTLDWEPLASGEAVYFQSFKGAQQYLVRAFGTTVTEEQLPECVGDPNLCITQLDLVFAVDGAERAIARTRSSSEPSLLERGPSGWVVKQALEHVLHRPVRFAREGLAASCRLVSEPYDAEQKLCLSRDGATVEVLELPELAAKGSLSLVGDSPDDFYLIGSEKLLHRMGSEWLEEGVSGERAVMVTAADGARYHRTGDTLYRLDGDCWQALASSKPIGASLVPTKGRTFLSVHDTKLCELVLE